MLSFSNPFASGEPLCTGHIHTINAGSVISKQSGQGSPNYFTPVHHTYRAAEESVPVRQDGIVDTQILQDLDHGQWRAGKDTFLFLCLIQVANVLVHVEDIPMAQPFHILRDIDNLL